MPKKLVLVLVVPALLGCLCWGQSAAERKKKFAAFEQEAIAREQALAAAEKRHDLDTILAALDRDFLEIAGDGNRYTAADIARYFPDVHVSDVKLDDFRVQYAGRDGALLTYVTHVDATYQGQPLPPTVAVSSLWVRRGRRWKLLFHQATPKPEPAAPK